MKNRSLCYYNIELRFFLLFLNRNDFEIVVICLMEGLKLSHQRSNRFFRITLCLTLFESVDKAFILC